MATMANYKRVMTGDTTYGAAPNALFLVSDRMAENVFVMTATSKLMSQKFNTRIPAMKKKQETKYSAFMI